MLSSYIRQIYSATMPRENRMRPLNKQIRTIRVAHPGTGRPNNELLLNILSPIIKSVNVNDKVKIPKPRKVMNLIGKLEAEKKVSAASLSFLVNVHLDFPF